MFGFHLLVQFFEAVVRLKMMSWSAKINEVYFGTNMLLLKVDYER